MKRIKVGVIGAGFISQEAHIPNYLNNPSVEIAGVADPDKSKLKEVQDKFSVKGLHSDYKKLLNSGIDAVSICVPTKLHAQMAVDAAEKGIHVLCEKPIALNLQEADEMITTCRKNNVKLMIGFNYRFLENHQKMKSMIERKKIGGPFFVHGQFASAGPYAEFQKNKNSFYMKAEQGGGVLFDVGSHLIDLLIWLFGDITSVSAKTFTYAPNTEVDDVASLTLKFSNKIVGSITVMWTMVNNWSGMGNENFVKVFGTEGKIVSDFFGPSLLYYNEKSKLCKVRGTIQLTPKKFDPKMPFEALNNSWEQEIIHFIHSIKKDIDPPITGEDGRKSLECILKAYNSMT